MKSDYHGNGHTHATETSDVSHIRNVDVTHEMSDVHLRGIVTFLIGLTIMTVAAFFLMWAMFRALNSQEQSKESQSPASPMTMSRKERLPPEPRLQSAPGFGEDLEKEAGVKQPEEFEMFAKPKNPLWEINVLRQHWQMALGDGVTDSSGKVVMLPIKQAKQELLKQGLPVRTSAPATDEGDVLPTAASSGRTGSNRQ